VSPWPVVCCQRCHWQRATAARLRSDLIATTDPALAARALDLLKDTGVRFVVLHGSDAIERGDITSDLDVAVDEPPNRLIMRLRCSLHRLDLHPVILWNYDIGHSTTAILSTTDASEGVQLDMLCDADGRGMDGVKARVIIGDAITDGRWPRPQPVHELLYLLRKRDRKADTVQLAALTERARRLHRDDIAEARRIFRASMAERVVRLVEGGPDDVTQPVREVAVVRQLGRVVRRMAYPIGFWVELSGGRDVEHAAGAVGATFERFVPHVATGRRPRAPMAGARWLVTEIAAVRWRAGLFVSWTTGPRSCAKLADLHIDGVTEPSAISRQVVSAMERRLLPSR
jgi:hypothetical protein